MASRTVMILGHPPARSWCYQKSHYNQVTKRIAGLYASPHSYSSSFESYSEGTKDGHFRSSPRRVPSERRGPSADRASGERSLHHVQFAPFPSHRVDPRTWLGLPPLSLGARFFEPCQPSVASWSDDPRGAVRPPSQPYQPVSIWRVKSFRAGCRDGVTASGTRQLRKMRQMPQTGDYSILGNNTSLLGGRVRLPTRGKWRSWGRWCARGVQFSNSVR